MKDDFPKSVRVCLWSYDIENIDMSLPDHRLIIIKNILNTGASSAVSWLFDNFKKEEIVSAISNSSKSEWNKKSLSLWSLVFDVYPIKKTRFL